MRYTEVMGAHPGLTHVTSTPKGHFLALPQSLVEKYAEPTKLPPPQVKTFEANQDSIDTENTKARAAEIGESYMRFMAEQESSTKLESLPPNPDDLPRPVVNRMELEMMHTNTCDTYSTHSSPYMPSFQDARSVYDQRPSGPQLAWPHGSPSTQLRGGQESSRYETRSPLPVSPKPVAQYGVRRYPLKPVLEKDHSYESEAVFIEEYKKAYGAGSFAAVGEQYIKSAKPTAARDSGSVSTDQNTDASTSASQDYVNDQHLPTNTDPDSIKHSELPKTADSNQELSKQLKTANQELIEMTSSPYLLIFTYCIFLQHLWYNFIEPHPVLCTLITRKTNWAMSLFRELRPFVVPDVQPTGKVLGEGSYGSVEEAKIPGATCVIKKLHEALLPPPNEARGADRMASIFVEECRLMSTVRHPHIVQFLGVCFPPGSRLPALIMEKLLIDLHNLLENNPDIPLSIKQDILLDVSKGLTYLHTRSPAIIHRDLSARNVLLNSAMVAKIADLGNSRIIDVRPSQLMTMTKNPGNMWYMPPEAQDDTSKYNTSIDVFSFGNLTLFTLTQQFPKVKAATHTDPNTGRIVGLSEIDRRSGSFSQVYHKLGRNHPLALLAEQCLQNLPKKRPQIGEVLKRLEKAKSHDQYSHLNKLEMVREMERIVPLQQQMKAYEAQLREYDSRLKQQDQLIRNYEAQQKRDQSRRVDPVELSGPGRQSHPERRGMSRNASQSQPRSAQESNSANLQPYDVLPSPSPILQHSLSVGSLIQLPPENPQDEPRSGTIRWIGELAGIQGILAGIELVSA